MNKTEPLESSVSKPKEGEENRPPSRFTLQESTKAALEKQAQKEDRPMSRIVDQAIREYIERQAKAD